MGEEAYKEMAWMKKRERKKIAMQTPNRPPVMDFGLGSQHQASNCCHQSNVQPGMLLSREWELHFFSLGIFKLPSTVSDLSCKCWRCAVEHIPMLLPNISLKFCIKQSRVLEVSWPPFPCLLDDGRIVLIPAFSLHSKVFS